ncbi:MAG: hypothetical protein LWW97_02825 [Deltaproteobacteria bacterium]|nr:hypothetical protein [Deltaproteobacteria bacterium]
MNMKVSRWKILSIAVALVLGYAVNSVAFRVDVDEDTWADFAVRGQVSYKDFDKRSEEIDYRQNYFELTEAEFYVKGQINSLIQFFTQWECVYIPIKLNGDDQTDYKKERAYMKETGMNFLFAPEFKVRLGRIRIPVSRYHQRSDYGKVIATDYFYRYDVHEVFKGALDLNVNKTALNIREPGVVFFGDFFDGMLRYHAGLFNQPHNESHYEKDGEDHNYDGLRYTARLAFTPIMLGFKPESSLKGTRKDSYLGKKDILTIGAGYSMEEIYDGLDNEMYAVDAFFEKKYGSIVPNLGFGYIEAKETHRIDDKAQDSAFWFVQGQLLYDKVVGIGKPAIGAKFERMQSDKAYDNKDAKSDRLSVALNYYIKGYSAYISLGLDNVKYKDGAKDYLKANDKEDSFTDYSLTLQFIF